MMRTLLTVTLLATLTALVACSPPTATVDVGPLNTQNLLTLALADDRLAEEVKAAGGEVETHPPFPAFAPAAEAMSAGWVDATSGSSTAVVAALAGQADPVVFAVEVDDGTTQGIVAAPGTGIEEVADLSGRRVAINAGGTGEYLLRLALEQAGMAIEDVEAVNLAPPDAASAFAGGNVDAWATWDQYLEAATLADGAQVVVHARDIGASNRTVHVVSRELAEQNPALVVALYEALSQQSKSVADDPGILARAYRAAGAERAVAEAVARREPPRIEPAGQAFSDELAQVAAFYAEQGMTAEEVDVSRATLDVGELAG